MDLVKNIWNVFRTDGLNLLIGLIVYGIKSNESLLNVQPF